MNQSLLVLYTGGTIGMQMGVEGLQPASGFEARMREQAQHYPQLSLSWNFRELQPLLDSAEMGQAQWLQLRDAIVTAVKTEGYDAVLVLHGTDTLAYSAGALSFLLLGLGVPVVLTGSMQPAGAVGGDGWSNLFGALEALEQGLPAAVQVFFNGHMLHGARCSKLSSEAFDAFQVLPRRRQAPAATDIAELDWRIARAPLNVAVLPLFPGVCAAHVEALVASGARALLLECYGSGTGPSTDSALLDALRQAHAKGVVLAAISQCMQGYVEFAVYAAGSRFAEVGLVSGGGMTREAALGKLFALLGAGLTQAQVQYYFAHDLCGEMRDEHSGWSTDDARDS